MGTEFFFSFLIERYGIVIEYSCLSIAEIKNERIYTSTPLYAFMAYTGTILLFFTTRDLYKNRRPSPHIGDVQCDVTISED